VRSNSAGHLQLLHVAPRHRAGYLRLVSFTRDNPYVYTTYGGSGLVGAERARLPRKLHVQLGDADASADTGCIDGANDREQGRVRGIGSSVKCRACCLLLALTSRR